MLIMRHLQGQGYGFEADVWSAGVLLFSMLSGLSAFQGATDEQVCWSVLNQEIDLQSDPWPFVSPEAKEVVARFEPPPLHSPCPSWHSES